MKAKLLTPISAPIFWLTEYYIEDDVVKKYYPSVPKTLPLTICAALVLVLIQRISNLLVTEKIVIERSHFIRIANTGILFHKPRFM